jgi:hypothetical protein
MVQMVLAAAVAAELMVIQETVVPVSSSSGIKHHIHQGEYL